MRAQIYFMEEIEYRLEVMLRILGKAIVWCLTGLCHILLVATVRRIIECTRHTEVKDIFLRLRQVVRQVYVRARIAKLGIDTITLYHMSLIAQVILIILTGVSSMHARILIGCSNRKLRHTLIIFAINVILPVASCQSIGGLHSYSIACIMAFYEELDDASHIGIKAILSSRCINELYFYHISWAQRHHVRLRGWLIIDI